MRQGDKKKGRQTRQNSSLGWYWMVDHENGLYNNNNNDDDNDNNTNNMLHMLPTKQVVTGSKLNWKRDEGNKKN